MRKITGIEIIFISIALMILTLAVLNGNSMGNLYLGNEDAQSYVFSTVLFGVPVTLFMFYIAIFIKFYKRDYERAYIIIRLFLPVMFCLYALGYLIGLNIDSTFVYNMLLPWWLFVALNILFNIGNVYIFHRAYKLEIYNKQIMIYTVILGIFYLLMFSAVITDSAVYLEII